MGKIPAKVLCLVNLAQKSLLDILRADTKFLELLQKQFLDLVPGLQGTCGHQFRLTCFSEERCITGLGKPIVPKESAVC